MHTHIRIFERSVFWGRGGGEGKGGGAAGGSSGEFFWKWVGGRHSQPQVLLVLGAAVSPGRSGERKAQEESFTVTVDMTIMLIPQIKKKPLKLRS